MVFNIDLYTGDQELVKSLADLSKSKKIEVETATIVLQENDGKYGKLNKLETQKELINLKQDIEKAKNLINKSETEYLALPTKNNNKLTERGLRSKLNSKSKSILPNETEEACTVRNKNNRYKRTLKRLKKKYNKFLRQFHIFVIGVDAPSLQIIKNGTPKEKISLFSKLKARCLAYKSRWCIESCLETIKHLFPFFYQGTSSATQKRIFVLQSIIFNDYKISQIEHISSTKPHNWRPWDPKLKCLCRHLRPDEQRLYTTKAYLLEKLEESLKYYFEKVLK